MTLRKTELLAAVSTLLTFTLIAACSDSGDAGSAPGSVGSGGGTSSGSGGATGSGGASASTGGSSGTGGAEAETGGSGSGGSTAGSGGSSDTGGSSSTGGSHVGAGGTVGDDAGAPATCEGAAHYMVTLDATWSQTTHPGAFPNDAHFSALIGGSHGADYVLWRSGGQASRGIKDMAENGGTSILKTEVQAAVAAGTALSVLEGQGISPTPGMDSAQFDVDAAHPLVSMGSMLAPTPDWFTGVDSANLCGVGGWIADLVVDALVYDAGTKSGEELSYDGSETTDPIGLRDYGLFAGKTKVGTIHFIKQ